MNSDQARDLRQQGIMAAKAGQQQEARKLLQQAIRLDPTSEIAWLWLASVARDGRERKFCLMKVLELNPEQPQALQGLAALRSRPAPPPEQPPAASAPPAPQPAARPPSPYRIEAEQRRAAPASEQEIMSRPPGVPMPPAERLADAQRLAEVLLREAQTAPEASGVRWVRRTRGRAGEGDILRWRMRVIAAAVAVIVFALLAGGLLLAASPEAQRVVFGPSATPTASPTFTRTPTPGLTPTPSVTPERSPTASPTPPAYLRPADPDSAPRPTAVYPDPRLGSAFDEAILALDQGDAAGALPVFTAERVRQQENASGIFQPAPYYYEALANIRLGRYRTALSVLERAQDAMTQRTTPTERALIASGHAQAFLALALQEQAQRNPTQMRDYAQRALDAALDAVGCALPGDLRAAPPPDPPVCDPALVDPYLVAARAVALLGDPLQALQLLDDAGAVESLADNTLLMLEKATLYLAQNRYAEAGQQAFLARYVDPTSEGSYRLGIAASLAQGHPGDAVLLAQTWLLWYPGSADAWRALGDARAAEGNADLALAAYAQALQGGTPEQRAAVAAARAAIQLEAGQPGAAYDELSAAIALDDRPAYHAARLAAALEYPGGALTDSLQQDIAAAREAGILSDALQGRALVAAALAGRAALECPQDTGALSLAASLLTEAVADTTLDSGARGAVYEALSVAWLCVGETGQAGAAAELALQAGESASRYYWRGRSAEAQGDLRAARRDYEWALTLARLQPGTLGTAQAAERIRWLSLATTTPTAPAAETASPDAPTPTPSPPATQRPSPSAPTPTLTPPETQATSPDATDSPIES